MFYKGTLLKLLMAITFSLMFGACSGAKQSSSESPKANPDSGTSPSQPGDNSGGNAIPLISHSCQSLSNESALYQCSPSLVDSDDTSHTWSLDSSNSCSWVSIDESSGKLSGTPNDDQVGSCIIAFKVSDGKDTSSVSTYNVTIANVQPTLSIANSSVAKASGLTILRSDADVEASDEGFGIYSLDNLNASAPRCSDNGVLSIDATTGQIDYDVTDSFEGLCHILVVFDDENASENRVSASFTLDVTTAPLINAVTPPTDQIYGAGENIDFTLSFSTVVDVSTAGGSPRLSMDIGGNTAYADYVSGTGSTDLSFRYLVPAGLYDANGISLTTTIDLNGATIEDSSSATPASLSFSTPTLSSVLVDSDSPTINTASCGTSIVQDASYNCSPSALDPDGEPLTWSFDTSHDCSWLSIDSSTGVITGSPNDDQVASCTLAFRVSDGTYSSSLNTRSVTVINRAPTLSIANPAAITEDALVTEIASDAWVQASDEGFGTYELDHAGTSSPKCSDNSVALSINASTGAIQFQPSANYNGTCNIRVKFDDGNASNNSVFEDFALSVTPVNDPPSISEACTLSATEGVPYSCSPSVSDVDSGDSHSWSFDAGTNTCSWLAIDSDTGAISGSPGVGDVGSCTLAFKVNDASVDSSIESISLNIASAGPTFDILGVSGGADTSTDAVLTDASVVIAHWQEYAGSSSYDVSILDAATSSVVCSLQNVSAPSSSYQFSGCNLNPGTNYSLQVVARDGAGGTTNSSNGPLAFAVTLPQPDFSITGVTGGTDVTVDEYLMNGTQVSLNWESAPSVSSFEATIYESDGTTIACPTQTGISSGATSYSFSGCNLALGTSYVANLIAKDSSSTSYPATNNSFPFYVADSTAPATAMCSGGSGYAGRISLTSYTGTIVDSGGLGGNYGSNENCLLEILPGAGAIRLTTQSFDSREASDFLEVHNAQSSTVGYPTSATYLIGTYANGTTGPSITAESGEMTLYWESDNARNNAGFKLSYQTALRPSSFNITGVTGGSDNTQDFYLSDGSYATIQWTAADGASTYDVIIRDKNDRQTVCSEVQTVATSYSFASCELKTGNQYVVKVVAYDASGFSTPAANNGASFSVATPPPGYLANAYFKAVNSEAGDRFGENLSISGNTMAISAVGEESGQSTITNGASASADNSTSDAGAVYIYTYNGATWEQQAYLKAPNVDSPDYFGEALHLDGDTLVVGVEGEDSAQTTITNGPTVTEDNSSGGSSGAAYVFVRTGNTWTHQAYLKAPNGEALDYFGHDVALDGDTIVVGAHYEDNAQTTITHGSSISESATASTSGAAYVFVRSGTTWTQQAYLKAPNADSSDNFGSAVAISGDTIAVGAVDESSNQTTITNGSAASSDNSLSSSGAAYVFVRSGTTWTQQAYLKAPNAGAGDEFGNSLDIDGDTLVVGAFREDSSQQTLINGTTVNSNDLAADAGAAYVFVRTGSTWSHQAYLKAPNAKAGDRFGNAVEVDGDKIVIGAHWEDSGHNAVINGGLIPDDNTQDASGAAYVYSRTGDEWSFLSYLKASHPDVSDYFGLAVAIDGDLVGAGAQFEDSNANSISQDGTGSADNSASSSGAVYTFKAQ